MADYLILIIRHIINNSIGIKTINNLIENVLNDRTYLFKNMMTSTSIIRF